MLHTLVLLALMNSATPAPLTTVEVVERMLSADKDRHSTLAGYTSMRRYRFENKRVNKRAEMTVRVTCDNSGAKTFEVVDESGSGLIVNQVLHKMIDAERDASREEEREQTRIIPANYEFRLVGTDTFEGRGNYVLEVSPKTKSKYLIRGRIWVDAEDFAITRVEGRPARNPSFWVRSAHVVQKYQRTGQFWLPVLNESNAEARIFGPTSVSIEYFDYVPNVRESRSRQSHAEEGNQ
jgi:hypothetical protein